MPLPEMIGASEAMHQLAALVRAVAPHTTSVLITGETGVGKELVAEAVHKLSPRADRPFVTVNCAAIPEALVEAELFGHTRGAFTGAVQSRLGKIHAAQGGTIFFDEIGELPLASQAKLLRFLECGEVQRLGTSDVFRLDARVIAATNVDLEKRIEARLFREYLFYRLSVFPIEVAAAARAFGRYSFIGAPFHGAACRQHGCVSDSGDRGQTGGSPMAGKRARVAQRDGARLRARRGPRHDRARADPVAEALRIRDRCLRKFLTLSGVIGNSRAHTAVAG